MKANVKSFIFMLMITVGQAAWAQGMPSNITTYHRANLLGKKWLNICRYYTQGGIQKSDRANMMIFSLTDNEFSYGKSPEFPMVFTAMSLK